MGSWPFPFAGFVWICGTSASLLARNVWWTVDAPCPVHVDVAQLPFCSWALCIYLSGWTVSPSQGVVSVAGIEVCPFRSFFCLSLFCCVLSSCGPHTHLYLQNLNADQWSVLAFSPVTAVSFLPLAGGFSLFFFGGGGVWGQTFTSFDVTTQNVRTL